MPRSIARICPSRLGLLLPALLLAASLLAGCGSPLNMFIAAAYLIGGPPSIAPEFDFETGKSMTDKDVTVAVVCYAPKNVRFSFHDIDHELAEHVAKQMFKRKIQVINPDRIRDWIDRHPNWDRAAEIGTAFKTKYVVHIELGDFALYEKDSVNLFRGQAEAFVTVWEMDEDHEDGEPIFSRDIAGRDATYPLGIPRSSYDTTYTTFKAQYLTFLSERIGRLFYEHYQGDDFPDVN